MAIRSLRQRFMMGYLPYATLAIVIIYVLSIWIRHGIDEFTHLGAMGTPILQLVILRIPWQNGVHFHGACILITAASLLLSPFIILGPFIAFLFS
jgi:hypothetical protein